MIFSNSHKGRNQRVPDLPSLRYPFSSTYWHFLSKGSITEYVILCPLLTYMIPYNHCSLNVKGKKIRWHGDNWMQ
jgi:hypothetical protein